MIFIFAVVVVVCSLCCVLLNEAAFYPSNLTYDMARNKLTQVPRDIPKESVNIFLQKNKISTIVDYTFIDNIDCEDLKLDYNKLEKITYKMLKGLYSLKWLDLSKNYIKQIEPKAFADLTNLQVLYLADNLLKYLSEDVLPEGHNLSNLKLHGNPLPSDSVELCWVHQGALDGWITGFTLDAQTAVCCDEKLNSTTADMPTTTPNSRFPLKMSDNWWFGKEWPCYLALALNFTGVKSLLFKSPFSWHICLPPVSSALIA